MCFCWQRCVRLHAAVVVCHEQCHQLGHVYAHCSVVVERRAERQVDEVEHDEADGDKQHEESAVHVLDVLGHDGSECESVEDADGHVHATEPVVLEQTLKLAITISFDANSYKIKTDNNYEKSKQIQEDMTV